ncbi:MAG: hypothetical protein AAGD01_12285 [Acidobacteriota bacterium]
MLHRPVRVATMAIAALALVATFAAYTPTADAASLAVNGTAALEGSFGMEITFDGDTQRAYVEDGTPTTETHYNAKFRFDPNSITMEANKRHKIFQGNRETPSTIRLMTVIYRKNDPDNFILVKSKDDNDVFQKTAWISVPDGPILVEIDWRAATGVGANNGEMRLWVDGVLQDTVSGIDNDEMHIDYVRMGAVGNINTTTIGTQFFDSFESFR